MQTSKRRLAPTFAAVTFFAVLLGAVASVAVAAFAGKPAVKQTAIVPYPKLAEGQAEKISALFDPNLPFNENVVADAFQDRAGLSKSEAQAAFSAPVVRSNVPAPSGYEQTPSKAATAPAAPTPAPTPVDDKKARADAVRRNPKYGTRDEASLYNWRELLPLGIAGYGESREVRFKSTLTGREFSARKGTAFADATLENVTPAGVVFRDAAGTHDAGWSRSRAAEPARTPNERGGNTLFSPVEVRPAPSGYAEGVGATIAKP